MREKLMEKKTIQDQLAELTAEYDRLRETIEADQQKLEEDTRNADDLRDRINELTRLTGESYPESTAD